MYDKKTESKQIETVDNCYCLLMNLFSINHENVQRQIDENRAEYKQLLIEGQNPPPLNICIAVVHVENALT
jgi:hypothetical protein